MQVTSEGPVKITKAMIEAAWKRRQKEQRLIIRDKNCRGLALVVNATTMVWTYSYRPRGRDPATGRRWPNRAMTLGNPASLSVNDARDEANRIKGRAAAGKDPAAERKAEAEVAQRRRASTCARLINEYANALPRRQKMRGAGKPGPRYVAEELAQLRMALAEMNVADKPVAELNAGQVRKLLESAEGVTTARKRFGPLSRFLDWCKDGKYIPENPCNQIGRQHRPKPPQARAHHLEPAGLARLWHAAERLKEPVWRDLARFLIAVPCRRGEAAHLDWSHIDLGGAEWRQPGQLTKNRDPHRIHLHPLALDVLRARHEAKGGKGLVFPGPVSGKVIDTFTDIKAALADATKLQDGDDGEALTGWTWHDFRRSFATALGEAGIPETVVDAMLNHRQAATRGGVLGVYQRASRWPEQVRAMRSWGQLLATAIEGKEASAQVVLLREIYR
jgi:integrase